MKRMLALVLFIGVIFFCNNVNAEITQKTMEAAQTMIRAAGYKSDKVDKMRESLTSSGFIVYCNGYKYKYELKDVGGTWKVTVE